VAQLEKFLDKFAKLGGDAVKRQRAEMFRALQPELIATIRRVSEIKNLLYRQKSAPLRSVFVEPVIVFEEESFGLDKIYSEFHNRTRLVLRGSAGLGKSVLLKYMCLHHIDKNSEFAPLFLELRKIDSAHAMDIVAALHAAYSGSKSSLNYDDFKKAISEGVFSVLLDGFDEIQPDIREKVEGAILRFAYDNPGTPLIVSGRSERSFLSWEQFTVVDIAPMTQELTVKLINKLEYNETLKKKFIDNAIPKLYSNRDRSFVQTPLLAILMLLTYETYADVPDKMYVFYSNAFETLIREHDVTKSQFRRPLSSGLAEEDFKRLFAAFCAATYSARRFEFSRSDIEGYILKSLRATSLTASASKVIDDLTLSICVMQYENLEYSFVHRSFQEYFTAVYLRDSPFSVVRLFLQRNRSGSRENVLPMLMGMDRDRIEKEWSYDAINELHKAISGSDIEDRVIAVFQNYWVGMEFGIDASGDVIYLGVPESELFRKTSVLDYMYPVNEHYMWWLQDFASLAKCYQSYLQLSKEEGLPVETVERKEKDELRNDNNMAYRIPGSAITLETAKKTGLYDVAVYLINTVDRCRRDIIKRVESRDSFADNLFGDDNS
jgi:hypothetical protein